LLLVMYGGSGWLVGWLLGFFVWYSFVYSSNYRILPQQPIFWVKNYLLARMRKIAAGLFMGQ